MSLRTFLKQTIEVVTVTYGAEDAMGNREPVDGMTAEFPGLIRQTSPTEVTVDRDTAISDWQLVTVPDAPIGHESRIREGGRTFEVFGAPYPVPDLRGGVHRLEARLRLVEG